MSNPGSLAERGNADHDKPDRLRIGYDSFNPAFPQAEVVTAGVAHQGKERQRPRKKRIQAQDGRHHRSGRYDNERGISQRERDRRTQAVKRGDTVLREDANYYHADAGYCHGREARGRGATLCESTGNEHGTCGHGDAQSDERCVHQGVQRRAYGPGVEGSAGRIAEVAYRIAGQVIRRVPLHRHKYLDCEKLNTRYIQEWTQPRVTLRMHPGRPPWLH